MTSTLQSARPAVTATPLGEAKCYRTRQSLHLEQSFRASTGHTLRAHIRRDSVPHQSSAIMETLEGQTLKWNLLNSVPYSLMSPSGNGYDHPGSAAQRGLERDVQRLLDESLVLIGAVNR